MIIQTYKSRKDVQGKQLVCDWPTFAKRLARCKHTAETIEDYAAMSSSARGEVKDVGGFVGGEMHGTRSAASIGERWLVTLDIDHGLNANTWDDLHLLYTGQGGALINCALYPTHSYTPEDPHLRWVFPLTRGVTAEEYRQLCAVLSVWVGAHTSEQGLDESTNQPERLMYWPSAPCDFDYASVFRCEVHGVDLDPDWILSTPEAQEAIQNQASRAPIRSCADLRVYASASATTGPSNLPATSRVRSLNPDINDETIPLGHRDQTLTSIAGKMRRAGLDANEIYAALTDVNERRCEEPLEDGDVRRIAESVSRYARNDSALVPIMHRGEDVMDMGVYLDCDVPELEDAAAAIGLGDSLVAQLLTTNIGEQVLYTPSRGLLMWNGERYVEDPNKVECILMDWVPRARQQVKAQLSQVTLEAERARNFGDEEQGDRLDGQAEFLESLYKFLGKYLNHGARSGVLQDWQSRCSVPDDSFDSDPFLLNTPDGIIDLRTGETRAAVMQDRVTQITRVGLSSYTDEGAAIWQEFLHTISGGDAEWEEYLQCAMGLACIGKVINEGFFACVGEGGNGKSTLINAVAEVLGTYASMVDNRLLTSQRNANLGPVKATLRGKRLVIAGELEENSILSASQVKGITSSDPITGEEKYKAPCSFTPSHTLVLYSNFLPRVTSSDTGTWRRIWVVPFNVRLYGTSNEVKRYDEVLRDKCSGAILAWLVEGARKIQARGFVLPKCEASAASVDEYKREENPLPRFVADKCVVQETASCRGSDLLIEYNQWARLTHEHEFTAQRFGRELTRLGFEREHKRDGWWWTGIRLRNYSDDLAENV